MPAPQGFLDRPAGTFAAGSPERPASWVVDFKDGSREMRDLLGGKGANVAEMTRVLGAERVPAGFTVTTEACVAYLRSGAFPERARWMRCRRRWNGSRVWPGAASATPPTRCWCRSARGPASRCPGCSTPS